MVPSNGSSVNWRRPSEGFHGLLEPRLGLLVVSGESCSDDNVVEDKRNGLGASVSGLLLPNVRFDVD